MTDEYCGFLDIGSWIHVGALRFNDPRQAGIASFGEQDEVITVDTGRSANAG